MPPKTPPTTPATEDAGSPAAIAAATLRQRRGKPNKVTTTASTTTTTTGAPPSAGQGPAFVASTMSPQRVLGIGAALSVSVFVALIMSLLLVQVYAVDKLDLRQTQERLRDLGMGEDWFPVWMGRLILEAITEQRGDDGGEGRAAIDKAGPAPPPSARTPGARSSGSGSSSASSPLRCYTLEGYSAAFLQQHSSRSPPLFSCGTRVIDLRTEDRPEVLRACASVGTPAAAAASSENGIAASQGFPTLRVVLTEKEVQWHRETQPVNTVVQRIPLNRVNDDYCDCLDGTDELLTNACSMAGPLTPGAGGARWKSYLISTQSMRLWEANDAVTHEDLEKRGYPLQPRKRGDVADRLYLSPGPVLPFVCTCGGVVRQLLAPSLLGDGIVDCCEGEDEAVLQGSPHNTAAPSPASPDPVVAAAHTSALEKVRAAMEAAWHGRQATIAAVASASSSSYTSAVYPHHTSARALLVDMGCYSLFTAAEVVQERRAATRKMVDLHRRGNVIQRLRVEKGWEELGRHLLENSTNMQLRMSNVTRELEALEQSVRQRMSEAGASDPVSAGVPIEELEYHHYLMQMRRGMESEVKHMGMTMVHRAYGDHYEYYPLVNKVLHIAAEQVADSSTPQQLSPSIAADRERRFMSVPHVARVVASPRNPTDSLPPLHVDNVSVSHYGIEVMRQAMGAQRYDASEGLFVAQQLRLLPDNNPAAYTPDLLKGGETPFDRAPVVALGSWQPYYSDRNSRNMILTDPAGDVHLPWRAGVAPASPLYRGGGRLQMPTRYSEPPHNVKIADAEEQRKSAKDRLKDASEGVESTKEQQVNIPHHTHMPSLFAVNVYTGGMRCVPDALATAPSPFARGQNESASSAPSPSIQDLLYVRAAYLCDTKDRILQWAKDGKCRQEVIIGTPSACTGWALKAFKDRLAVLSNTTA